VEYRIYRGRSINFDTTGARLASVGAQTTSFTDTTVEAGSAYYYRVAALDNDGLLSEPTSVLSALLQPETVSVSASRSFGDGTQQSDYRLIALPGQVNRGVQSTFDGEAGDAWQAYWDNGSSDDFLVSFDGSSTFQFEPGRGFWAISETSWTVEESLSTIPLSQGSSGPVVAIELHDGWNIISNPLGKDVAWTQVQAVNGGTLQPLWRFDGSFNQTNTFASAKTGAAFYFNNQSGLARLQIPYVSSQAQVASSTTESSQLLSVTAKGPETSASTVRLGTSESATDGIGPDDIVAPPHRFEALSLRVQAKKTKDVKQRQQSLVQSVRQTGGDGQVYHLALRTKDQNPVTIQVSDVEALDGDQVRLLNRETGASFDLRNDRKIEVTPQANTTRMVVITGNASFVQKEQARYLPSEVSLRSNYPNPFRKHTTIEYTLPEPGRVTVEVFDVLGRKVRVLVNDQRKAGPHRVTWNGQNGSGQGVASGVYLTRLTFKGETITQKMVLVK